jgi:hypothetical protein
MRKSSKTASGFRARALSRASWPFFRLGHHREALGLEARLQPQAEKGVVVGDEDPHLLLA